MSEYQFVIFQAIDGPVSPKNMEYMERQSSRADITQWSFENEYHYGDFHGNALEMLRRGYDMHLHYANFGTRTLMIRLPNGIPDQAAWKPYLTSQSLRIEKDKQGVGCTLVIEPGYEPDTLEQLWDVDEVFEELIPLRAEILEGDLRPLYLAHLAVCCDINSDPDEALEGPVPAGLSKLTDAQIALAEFYGLSEALVKAAAKESPPLAVQKDLTAGRDAWIQRQPESRKNSWLSKLIGDSAESIRAEILNEFRASQNLSIWPVAPGTRTISELQEIEEDVASDLERRRATQADQKRKKLLAKLAADPDSCLKETEKLALDRSRDSYDKIAEILSDLREALAGTDKAGLAEQQAGKLKELHPTLKMLMGALKRKDFLSKKSKAN